MFSFYSSGSCESPFSPLDLPSLLGARSHLPTGPSSYHPLDGTAYPFPLQSSRPSSPTRTNSDELPSSSWSSSSSSNGAPSPPLRDIYASAMPNEYTPPLYLLFQVETPADVAHNRTKHGGCTPGAPPLDFVRCCEGRREGKGRAKNQEEQEAEVMAEEKGRKEKAEVIEKWRETSRAMTLPVLKRRSNPLAGGMWMSRVEKDGSMEASKRGIAQEA